MNYDNLCINCFKDTQGYEICSHCGCVQTEKPKQLNHLYPRVILNERYIVGKALNNGGFGVIYKAYDTKLDIVVAIKELFPTQNSMATRVPETTKVITLSGEKGEQFELQKERFLIEARTMSKLSYCESIVSVYDFFEENNTVYLVMEFLDGMSLKEYLENHTGKMSYDEVMQFAEPVMEALSAVHKEKIVHRDVSPDNIFITNDGKIKLLDFGAAKFDENDIEKSVTVIAKPGYTPPEQYRSKAKIKPYTDIYAMAAMIYRMVTGELPEESIDRVEKDELKRPSKLGAELPSYAEKSIMKAMALNENARFKTMNDFLMALQGKKKADFPENELKRKRIIRSISFVAVFAIIITSIFGGMGYRNSVSFVPDDCSISIWLAESDKEDESMWDEIINDFFVQFCSEQKNNPKVNIEISFIDDELYSKKFIEAFSKSEEPDLYRADLVENATDYSADLSKLSSEINESDMAIQYSALKNNYIDKSNQFAFRFDSLVMYTNISISKSDDLDDWSKAEIYGKTNNNKNVLSVSNKSILNFAKQCGYKKLSDTSTMDKIYPYSACFNSKGNYIDSLDLFGQGKIGYYIGNASDRVDIDNYIGSDSLHAYKVSCISGFDNCYYYFPEFYSISSKSNNNQKKAAMFLLYFISTNNDVQTDLKGSSKGYMPISKSIAEKFKDDAHGLYTIYESTDENSFIDFGDVYELSMVSSDMSEIIMNNEYNSSKKQEILLPLEE